MSLKCRARVQHPDWPDNVALIPCKGIKTNGLVHGGCAEPCDFVMEQLGRWTCCSSCVTVSTCRGRRSCKGGEGDD